MYPVHQLSPLVPHIHSNPSVEEYITATCTFANWQMMSGSGGGAALTCDKLQLFLMQQGKQPQAGMPSSSSRAPQPQPQGRLATQPAPTASKGGHQATPSSKSASVLSRLQSSLVEPREERRDDVMLSLVHAFVDGTASQRAHPAPVAGGSLPVVSEASSSSSSVAEASSSSSPCSPAPSLLSPTSSLSAQGVVVHRDLMTEFSSLSEIAAPPHDMIYAKTYASSDSVAGSAPLPDLGSDPDASSPTSLDAPSLRLGLVDSPSSPPVLAAAGNAVRRCSSPTSCSSDRGVGGDVTRAGHDATSSSPRLPSLYPLDAVAATEADSSRRRMREDVVEAPEDDGDDDGDGDEARSSSSSSPSPPTRSGKESPPRKLPRPEAELRRVCRDESECAARSDDGPLLLEPPVPHVPAGAGRASNPTAGDAETDAECGSGGMAAPTSQSSAPPPMPLLRRVPSGPVLHTQKRQMVRSGRVGSPALPPASMNPKAAPRLPTATRPPAQLDASGRKKYLPPESFGLPEY